MILLQLYRFLVWLQTLDNLGDTQFIEKHLLESLSSQLFLFCKICCKRVEEFLVPHLYYSLLLIKKK